MQKQQDESYYLIALKLLKGVGNVGAQKLLSQFGSAKQLFQSSQQTLKSADLKASIITTINEFDFKKVDDLLTWTNQDNRHIITQNSPYYPPLLSQIHAPPLVLFVLGDPQILLSPQIAVVGSRSPTAQGISNTQLICQSLCEHGLTITSGLAMGIDGEAHRAALATNGLTIAVTGTGLNRVYPARHRELAHQIAQKGALVSECLPDEPHRNGNFPQRNRIIAGLSLGTLVVEAAQKSGTLITARHAAEEGREVYAIPGSIHNPLAKGCHKLIKEGAKLTESVEDIMEDLPQISTTYVDRSKQPDKPKLSAEDAQFLSYVDYEITSIDTIVARSELTVEAVTNKLLLLELQGWVINSVGGYIRQ